MLPCSSYGKGDVESARAAHCLIERTENALLKARCRAGHAILADGQVGNVVCAGGGRQSFAAKAGGNLDSNDVSGDNPEPRAVVYPAIDPGKNEMSKEIGMGEK